MDGWIREGAKRRQDRARAWQAGRRGFFDSYSSISSGRFLRLTGPQMGYLVTDRRNGTVVGGGGSG